MWSTLQRQKNIYGLDVHAGFEGNYRSIGYGSVHLYGYVLRKEDGHILRRALDFEVEGQRKKGRPKRTWKNRLRKKV